MTVTQKLIFVPRQHNCEDLCRAVHVMISVELFRLQASQAGEYLISVKVMPCKAKSGVPLSTHLHLNLIRLLSLQYPWVQFHDTLHSSFQLKPHLKVKESVK